MHVALDEQGILLRVQAAGDVLCQLLQSSAAQVRRILPHGDGVQVCHKVKTIIFLGTLRPVFHRAQVATQGQVTGGLDAG